MEDRITKLEKLIAFQEQSIEDLNEAILEQDKKIKEIENELRTVQAQLTDEELVKPIEDEEPPPHY